MSRRKSILEFNAKRTLPEKFADDVSAFVGSWRFIIYQTIFIFLWVGLNSFFLIFDRFDPYPFIFLNLILALSTVYLTPLIMMSQNRHEARNSVRDDEDLEADLRGEANTEMILKELNEIKKQLEKR